MPVTGPLVTTCPVCREMSFGGPESGYGITQLPAGSGSASTTNVALPVHIRACANPDCGFVGLFRRPFKPS
jgi:hypothetical protein